MKTLTLETCKRLFDAGIEMDTEDYTYITIDKDYDGQKIRIPIFNLEEAIELLPSGTRIIIDIVSGEKQWIGNNIEGVFNNLNFQYDSILELVEQMINYLLDNKLIGT